MHETERLIAVINNLSESMNGLREAILKVSERNQDSIDDLGTEIHAAANKISNDLSAEIARGCRDMSDSIDNHCT